MLDQSIDPCSSFYDFVCSKWRAQNPIPSDRAAWGRFAELQDRGEIVVRKILEKYSTARKRAPVEQKIGDYYSSCMDDAGIEKAGLQPLRAEFESIDAIKDRNDLVQEIARLHREGVDVFFRFEAQPDFKDATHVIATLDQGGLGLPDRDYYLKDDAKSVELRKQYQAHVQKMFELLGDPKEQAATEAETVVGFESGLAKQSMDRTSRRDPAKVYNRMTREQLLKLHRNINWQAYFAGVGAPPDDTLNLTTPQFFETLNALFRYTSPDTWKAYLRWHVVHANASMLPQAFVEEDFNFFGKTLQGTSELSPRWKRCVRATTRDLGDAVGRKYVEENFRREDKQRMLKMVDALEKAFAQDIQSLSWMGEDTRKQALAKLRAITNRMGYPDKWRDYSSLNIVRGDALGNSQRARSFEFQRTMNKIGKPVDKGDWPYPPTTIDASYNAQQNDITFPAGILQPPFYDRHADDALNYGAIGAVIGHELTHGFDDKGSQFDGNGDLQNWWTARDKAAFQERSSCIEDQYGGYTAVDDIKVNGKLTLGENIADNGGVRIAYLALMDSLAGKEPPPVDGLTARQRFFAGFANLWCQNRTDEGARMRAEVDSHSPGKYRVNGTVSNMPEFKEAFHCKTDAPMVRENACRVW
jgi:endothelin-converting enzyme/putative endopeptidase